MAAATEVDIQLKRGTVPKASVAHWEGASMLTVHAEGWVLKAGSPHQAR
jgi:hypothetical protein